MDANAIVYGMQHEGIISEGDLEKVEATKGAKQRNECLHLCLKRSCTEEALMKVCTIMINEKGNPKMKQFGEEMKGALEKGIHICVVCE